MKSSKRKSAKSKLKLIEDWLSEFPCKKYFGDSACVHEFLDAVQIKKLIDEEFYLYKHGAEIDDWVKNHIS